MFWSLAEPCEVLQIYLQTVNPTHKGLNTKEATEHHKHKKPLEHEVTWNSAETARGEPGSCHTWLCWLVIGVSDKQRSSIQSNREAEIMVQYQVLHDGFGLRLSCWWVPGVVPYKSEQQIEKGTKNSFLCCLRGQKHILYVWN